MFIASLFQEVETTKCPSVDEWIIKIWSIHTMKYYLAIKRSEVLIRAPTWMNLENMREIKEARHRDHKFYDPIHMKFQIREIYRDRKQIRGCLVGWREEKMGWGGQPTVSFEAMRTF